MSRASFSKMVRDRFRECDEAFDESKAQIQLDLKFRAGDTWDARVRGYREGTLSLPGLPKRPFPLPCLTVPVLGQYVNQVVGDWRANEVSITVLPDEDGDKDIATLREEMIRSVEKQSKTDRVYPAVFDTAAACGLSNMRVDIDDAYQNPFKRSLAIRGIPDPLAVLWDPLSFEITGRDAKDCIVVDRLMKADYEAKYKDAAPLRTLENARMSADGWLEANTVRIAEWWRMDEREHTFALLADGTVADVTDLPESQWRPKLAKGGPDGAYVAKGPCLYATKTMTNGYEQLGETFEVKLTRLPIVRISGTQMWVDGRYERAGVVRPGRDSQRMKDYFRSVRAEMLLYAARENFVAQEASIKGRTADWPSTRVYNDGTPEPQPIASANLASLLTEEGACTQDLRDVTGIHEASMGMPSNETSGVAIMARQGEGDISTIGLHDNMRAAVEEVGEIVNQLLDVIHDTPSTVRAVKRDGTVRMVRINDPAMLPDGNPNPESYKFGEGDPEYKAAMERHKGVSAAYSGLGTATTGTVTISTGPTYATRRQQGAAQIMQLASQDPQLMAVAGDIVVGELDLVNGDQIAERLKRAMPPQILGPDADDDKTPEEMAQQQQEAQQAQEMQRMGVMLEMRNKQADTDLKEAQAAKAQAEAKKAAVDAMRALQGDQPPVADPLDQLRLAIEGYNAETNRLKAVTAKGIPQSPDFAQQIAPVIAEAVRQALAANDIFAPASVGKGLAAAGQAIDTSEGQNGGVTA